jgi:hypothetical protein
MAVYKVPQDVEADDKLIGPFSFRQFIYLIIVAASGAIAWVLGQIFIGLAVIPLPFILFFGALALPLRKDQPMETYLAALLSFYVKPRKRLWDPDGRQALIEITAPKVADVKRSNGLSEGEAQKRLSYLADVVDSHGWSVRGVAGDAYATQNSMSSELYEEAQHAQDMFDESSQTSHQIDSRLDQTNVKHRQDLVQRMSQPTAQVQPQAAAPQSIQQPQTMTQPQQHPTVDEPHLTINPYPTMHQSVIQPASYQPTPQAQPVPQTTSENTPSADIMNLANNSDFSIETIAHEAKRLKEKQGLPDDEVVISLH